MGIKDLFITPVYVLFLSFLAYWIRPYVTTRETRKYFLPALWVRFFGAIMLGVIYQFYYNGGDTFNYFTHGSRWIWEAFWYDPLIGVSLLFESGGERIGETFQYSQHIWYYRDPSSYFIVRIAAFFDLFTFHTYSATALFFSFFSFLGSWNFFRVLVKLYPNKTKGFFYGIFGLPSITLWGSGIMKDSITLGALLLAFSIFINWIILRERKGYYTIIFILSCWILYAVKIYILACLIPCLFILIYMANVSRIRSFSVKVVLVPILVFFFLSASFLATKYVVSDSKRYSLENLPKWAMITAYDIGFWTGKNAGSGYSLGEQDGTWSNLLTKVPAAINVSLFRPYPWEVSNIFMALTSMESFTLLILFFYSSISSYRKISSIWKDPVILSFVVFICAFGFAVGVSTYNFGTLSRYRIPLLPFIGVVIAFLWNSKSRFTLQGQIKQ